MRVKGENLTVKSKGLSNKSAQSLNKKSFDDLGAGVVFHDPLGVRGQARSMKQTMYEWMEDAIKLFEEKHIKKNFSLYESRDLVRKSLDSGDWDLPVYHLPDVQVINPELTPLADMMPRQTVDNDTVKVQVVDDGGFPSVTAGLGGDTSSVRDWDYADASYSVESFDVIGYDTGTLIEDKLVLSSRVLRDATSVAQTNVVNAMRIWEEAQMIQGDGSNAGDANDSSGFEGLVDMNSSYDSFSQATVQGWSDDKWISKTRELITQVERKGGNRNNIAVLCGFDAYNYLANAMQDFTRYDVQGTDEIDFGFSTLNMDGVPVYKSHGFTDEIDDGSVTSSNPFMIAVDMGSHYMGTLQDVTLQPVPKTGPQEKVAVDAYTTLVSEAKPHVQWYDFS